GGRRGLEHGPARLEDVPLGQPPDRPRASSQTLVSLEGRGELRDLPALRRVDECAGILRAFRVHWVPPSSKCGVSLMTCAHARYTCACPAPDSGPAIGVRGSGRYAGMAAGHG